MEANIRSDDSLLYWLLSLHPILSMWKEVASGMENYIYPNDHTFIVSSLVLSDSWWIPYKRKVLLSSWWIWMGFSNYSVWQWAIGPKSRCIYPAIHSSGAWALETFSHQYKSLDTLNLLSWIIWIKRRKEGLRYWKFNQYFHPRTETSN